MDKVYTLNTAGERIRMYDKQGRLHFETGMTKEMANLVKGEANDQEVLAYIEKTYPDVIKDLP